MRYIMLCCLLASFSLLSYTPAAYIVEGVVKNEAGMALEGVTVMEKNTKNTVVTDSEGSFRMRLQKSPATLVLKMTGYITQERILKEEFFITVYLIKAGEKGEEPITGYGNRTKTLTGAVLGLERKPASPRSSAVSLKGAAYGISRSPSEVPAKRIDPVSTAYIKDKVTGRGRSGAGILTAGEWNDLDNWQYWLGLMQYQQWGKMQDHWKMNMGYGIKVQVQGDNQAPVVNKKVIIRNGQQIYWEARTDNKGVAVLWPDFREQMQVEEYTIEVVDGNNRLIGRKSLQEDRASVIIRTDYKDTPVAAADIMFVVDATGSMGDEISYLKAELRDIVGRIQKNQVSTRTGMVFYRDHGDEYLIRDFDFEEDVQKVQENLNRQQAGGGGDYEEAVEEALQNAIEQQRWNSRAAAKIIFLILDAPPHYDHQRIKAMQQNIEAAARKGIRIVPVVASGIDKNTEFLMRFMALATNGTYVFLTDDSGVGNAHLKPTVGKYTVERLNDLIVRLVKEYTQINQDLANNVY